MCTRTHGDRYPTGYVFLHSREKVGQKGTYWFVTYGSLQYELQLSPCRLQRCRPETGNHQLKEYCNCARIYKLVPTGC